MNHVGTIQGWGKIEGKSRRNESNLLVQSVVAA